MLVPSARNLHWRYEVLRSAFMACKQKVPHDANMQPNLDNLLEATSSIWTKISKNRVTIKGETRPVNGDIISR